MCKLLLQWPTTLIFKTAWLPTLFPQSHSWLSWKEWSPELVYKNHIKITKLLIFSLIQRLLKILDAYPEHYRELYVDIILLLCIFLAWWFQNERALKIKTRHVSLSHNPKPQLCFIIYYFILWWGIILIQEQLKWKMLLRCQSCKLHPYQINDGATLIWQWMKWRNM